MHEGTRNAEPTFIHWQEKQFLVVPIALHQLTKVPDPNPCNNKHQPLQTRRQLGISAKQPSLYEVQPSDESRVFFKWLITLWSHSKLPELSNSQLPSRSNYLLQKPSYSVNWNRLRKCLPKMGRNETSGTDWRLLPAPSLSVGREDKSQKWRWYKRQCRKHNSASFPHTHSKGQPALKSSSQKVSDPQL